MKILLISISSPHEITGIGKYNGELMHWFRNRGHTVDVLTALPYYPYWEIYEDYRHESFCTEKTKGGTIYSMRLPVAKQVSSLRRVLMDSTLGLKALMHLPKLARRHCYDILLLILPPLTLFPAALLARSIGGVKLHVHVQDLQIEAARELDLLPALVLNKLEIFEKKCFRTADLITTISENMRRQISKKLPDEKSVERVDNWADTKRIAPTHKKGWLKKKFGYSQDIFLVVYSGNIGKKQGLEQILPVAAALADQQKIQFLILGDGADKRQLLEKSKGYHLHNVQFGRLVPHKKLNLMLNGSDVQLVLQHAAAGDAFLPSKYINIIAAGTPSVVTAREGTELYKICTVHKTSIVTPPEQPQRMEKAIQRLYSNRQLCKTYATHARAFAVEKFGKNTILGSLEKRYSNLIEHSS